MLFNSLEFPVFLALVFTLYWALRPRNTRIQNLLLILASYVFYGWWDWRFLLLIVLSTAWRVWREWAPVDRRSPQKKAARAFVGRIRGRTTRHFENRLKRQRRTRFYDHMGS